MPQRRQLVEEHIDRRHVVALNGNVEVDVDRGRRRGCVLRGRRGRVRRRRRIAGRRRWRIRLGLNDGRGRRWRWGLIVRLLPRGGRRRRGGRCDVAARKHRDQRQQDSGPRCESTGGKAEGRARTHRGPLVGGSRLRGNGSNHGTNPRFEYSAPPRRPGGPRRPRPRRPRPRLISPGRPRPRLICPGGPDRG